MKLGIFGSRSLNKQNVYKFIRDKIIELQKNNDIEFIVTAGEIKGACKFARDICQELKITLKVYFYDYQKFNKGAFERRSKEIIKEGDYFLIFHDGQSKGTRNELVLLKKENKKYVYYRLNKLDSVKAKNIITELTKYKGGLKWLHAM